MKKNIILLGALLISVVFLFSFMCSSQNRREQDRQALIGNWIPEDSNFNDRSVFNANNSMNSYIDGRLFKTYNWELNYDSPFCGREVDSGPNDVYLKLTELGDQNRTSCYIVYSLDNDLLEMSLLERGGMGTAGLRYTKQ